MINPEVYGFHAEGQILCFSCAQRIYGDRLEMNVITGDIQILREKERAFYASKGLLCDDCSTWIFQPHRTEDSWWLEDPDPEEYLRLLAPFADFLETREIDVTNLRDLSDI